MSGLTLILLRHTEVAAAWLPRCYGRAEAGLSAPGRRAARAIAEAWTAPAGPVFASPARRARLLGGRLAQRLETSLILDRRLAERHFGLWEGEEWEAIWCRTGKAMDGMIDAPDSFRPGGGETTAELAARVLDWCAALPAEGTVIAVSHGGPIAALVGSLRGEAARGWLAHVPRPGGGVELHLRGTGLARSLERHAPLSPVPVET